MAEMLSEHIGKASLNYRFYQGADQYSDGDIEDVLLIIVQGHDSYEDALMRENDWALLYHLSPIRENLLEWYDFGEGKSLLESGAGCGAITDLEFYYPLPDYKLPTEIYSQRRLAKDYPFAVNTPNYDRDRYSFFDEAKVMDGLIREGKFERFANPFLVFCEGGARE